MTRKVKAQTLDRERAKRLHQALELRGWTVPQAARRAGLNRDIVDDVLRGNGMGNAWIVSLAEALGVDPRWLALGLPSAAGASAQTLILCAKTSGLDQVGRRAVTVFCAAIPEPDKGAGVCRYCLCTDEHGCSGCTWVDEAATICSTCLEPAET